ncbi:hypothetical protein [Fulvimonas yonginensis]|uniref:Uncharacterized protein n=1 Tax=Fulvimonas yonginensis TaxID=1495200 RepID=A0ABU8JAS8_9GAMM
MPNYTSDQDLEVGEEEVTPELLDRYRVVSATAGDRSYVPLRPDRRLGRLYHRDTEPEVTQPLPTLWIRVPDYEDETLARLQELIARSDERRLGVWAIE